LLAFARVVILGNKKIMWSSDSLVPPAPMPLAAWKFLFLRISHPMQPMLYQKIFHNFYVGFLLKHFEHILRPASLQNCWQVPGLCPLLTDTTSTSTCQTSLTSPHNARRTGFSMSSQPGKGLKGNKQTLKTFKLSP